MKRVERVACDLLTVEKDQSVRGPAADHIAVYLTMTFHV